MSSGEFPEAPPKPRLTIRVGVTGKRKLPKAEIERIGKELARVFEIIAQVLTDCWEKDKAVLDARPPVMRIVCGLAEGTDQIAARIAVDRTERKVAPDSRVETRLAAILPFWREEFIKDFRQDPDENLRTPEEFEKAVGVFDALLAEATKEAVLEIHDEALLASGKREERDLGYVALRDLLIQHSDVVISVFDENQERKPGGSADVTQLAAQEGIPVIRISTGGSPVCLLYAPEPDDPVQRPTKKKDETFNLEGPPPAALVKLLAPTLSPPQQSGSDGHGAAAQLHSVSRSGRARLADFIKEDFKPPSFAWIFKSCRNGLVQWATCTWRNCVAGARNEFRSTRANYSVDAPAAALAKLWPAAEPLAKPYSTEAHFRGTLATRYVSADLAAVCHADGTRSSYIAIAFFGAVAVLVGLLAVWFWGHVAAPAKALLLGIEGYILWKLAVLFYRPAHGGSWHERMVEYRVLAELLRHQRFVYALGGASRAERTGDRSWRGADAWLGWYVQATTRELGFPTARLSPEYRRAALAAFDRDELSEQVGYNKRERDRNKTIDESLGRFVEGAWRVAVWTAAVGAIVVFVLWIMESVPGPLQHPAETLLDHVVKPGLTIAMAFLPALIAAVHGVRFQMEFANASKRADATFSELNAIRDNQLLNVLGAGGDPGRRACDAIVRAANSAMVADLSGWSTVYKHKAAELP